MNNKDMEQNRQQLWADVWVAVATSSNCTKVEVPTNWADHALAEFDKRFKELDKRGGE